MGLGVSTVSIKNKNWGSIKCSDRKHKKDNKKIIAWLLKNWSYCLVSTWFVDDAEQMRRKRWKMWERINIAISQNACLNIGVPMYGPFSDVWIVFQMDGPYIEMLSIHRRMVHTSECYPYIGTLPIHWRSIHQNAIHTSERYPYIGGPYIGMLSIHRSSNVWTSYVWIAFWCMDPPMYGPSNGRQRGSFSGWRGSNLWIGLYPPEKYYIFLCW